MGHVTSRHRLTATALGVLAGTVAGAGTIAVTSAGFALSFDAIRAVGAAAHLRPSLTWLLPVCVDGAMAVSAVCAVVLKRMGRGNIYPWSVVVIGAVISIAANALHAYQRGGDVPLPVGWAMAASAVPALLLALSVHLVVILAEAVRQAGSEPTEASARPAVHPAADLPEPESSRVPARNGSAKNGSAKVSRKATTADRVARLVSRQPDLSKAQVAVKLGVSERTVQRVWPAEASPNGSKP